MAKIVNFYPVGIQTFEEGGNDRCLAFALSQSGYHDWHVFVLDGSVMSKIKSYLYETILYFHDWFLSMYETDGTISCQFLSSGECTRHQH